MPGVKDQVIEMIQALPDDVTLDDVMAEIYFRMRVDASLADLENGLGIPHQEVKER